MYCKIRTTRPSDDCHPNAIAFPDPPPLPFSAFLQQIYPSFQSSTRVSFPYRRSALCSSPYMGSCVHLRGLVWGTPFIYTRLYKSSITLWNGRGSLYPLSQAHFPWCCMVSTRDSPADCTICVPTTSPYYPTRY